MSIKRLLSLLLYLVLAIVLVSLLTLPIHVSVVKADSVVTFPDPNLEAAIRQAISKPTGDIYQSDLTSLTTLSAESLGIVDLTGLEHCTSLGDLYLSSNQINDISPLSGLTSLTDLSLYSNQISDIEPLVNNTGIASGDTVDLRANPLSSISVSTYIPALQGRGVTVYYTALSNQAPNQPGNVSPSNGATGISLTPTLQSSAFSDPDLGDSHAASQWQITTTSGDYSSPVFDSGTDTSNLTSITLSVVILNGNTTYYWHVRYQDNHGAWSSYSAETFFTTAAPPNNPPNQPSDISPSNGAIGISLTPTLQASAFSDPDLGDSHAASQWQITTTSGDYSSPVFDSGTDNSNLTSITIPTLNYSTTYYWHVRQQDNHGAWSSYSSETFFTTAAPPNNPPSQPSNDLPSNGATGVSLTPTLQSSSFSDPDVGDIHAASQWQISTTAGNYSSPVFDSGPDGSHLVQITLSWGILGGDTTYYWHVRYLDNHAAWSEWSAETSFTTMNRPPNQPVNTSPANGATGVSLTPTLASSGFSDPDAGDTHAASQWQITMTAGNYSSPVFDSNTDSSNLTSITIPTLNYSTTYY